MLVPPTLMANRQPVKRITIVLPFWHVTIEYNSKARVVAWLDEMGRALSVRCALPTGQLLL